MIAQVHSIERDQFGDPIETPQGTIDVIPGGLSVGTLLDAVTATSGQMGVRRGKTSTGYTLEDGDKLTLPSGCRYALQGPPLWDYPSNLTGTEFAYRWWKVTQSN
ncbi:hypothetical protein [Mycolicibacterium holsaticum]|uniref:Uncharacterized protein n=1 Tax=Mycolicibacterium holsaticum TaxID=152142 RepID=A0A1E3S398_9MYCO|nr:hypothetical protein [Mycolicibacterium holsaticum]ODQ96599.1 hypothetical protein BHQ17_00035 [Mycolicibacterium holsaticum]